MSVQLRHLHSPIVFKFCHCGQGRVSARYRPALAARSLLCEPDQQCFQRRRKKLKPLDRQRSNDNLLLAKRALQFMAINPPP